TRRGTELEWTQELGFQDSNSDFFIPEDQANSRLSLSINKPLLSRGGRYYNERLITQARFDDRVAWQQLRGEVEERIAEVIIAYWQLYRIRAQLTQQKELLRRSLEIERLLISRRDFDAARIEISKANQRVARRSDQLIELEATLKDQQVRLANLVGSDSLAAAGIDLELIPTGLPQFSNQSLSQRDALAEALKFRPEIRLATANVASSALEMKITRTELEPQLNWIFDAYLSQLNGSSQAFRSFGEQFVNAPSVSTALEFELPKGRRAAKASYREAVYRARQRSELLREAIQQTQLEVQTALIEVDRFAKQLVSKRRVLETAIVEENILTTQWRIIGGDDSRVGIKLENLLDAQQRRTDAEKDLVTVETGYMIALVRLQRAMGTLLIREGLPPHRSLCSGDVQFLRDSTDSSLDVSHTCGELTDSQDVEVDQQGQSFLPERPRELGEPVSSDSIDSETLELPPPVSE
ncbi:MAG: TolC family protein, partial [Planctomycetota bacterium]